MIENGKKKMLVRILTSLTELTWKFKISIFGL